MTRSCFPATRRCCTTTSTASSTLCSSRMRLCGWVFPTLRHWKRPLVISELMRIEGEAFVGQSASGEIDFITNGSDGPRYHQVSESVRDPHTLERELSSLRAVRDGYPKTLITLDDERLVDHEGKTGSHYGLVTWW